MNDLIETMLRRETVFQGRVITLHVDDVQLPNTNTTRREVVQHPGAVAILPIDREGRVVMVEQYRYAIGRVLLEIPAGSLKPGEDPDLCAGRELQEETGYSPGTLTRIGAVYLAPGYSSEIICLYAATDLTDSRLDMDDDEFINVKRLTTAELLEMIGTGAVCDAKTVSAVMLGMSYLR